MCLYPLIKFACCDAQYKPTTPDLQPIVKFCPRGHPDTIREPFPGCDVREPHECGGFFRLPIQCPRHKLEWLTAMDLNRECQATDAALAEAGVSEALRFRYRDKMGRAFEMVVKCAERMEAERLQAWKVKMFCAGAALELLGTAIVGSDAKPLDYGVLEGLRERLIRHINTEARQLMEEVGQEQGRGSTSQGAEVDQEVAEATSAVGLPPALSAENQRGDTMSGATNPELDSAQLLGPSASTADDASIMATRLTAAFNLAPTASDNALGPASTPFPPSDELFSYTPSRHPFVPGFYMPEPASPHGTTPSSVTPYSLSSLTSHVEGYRHRGHIVILNSQATWSAPPADCINNGHGSGSGGITLDGAEADHSGLPIPTGGWGAKQCFPSARSLQTMADEMED
jgi:hypothetical protein